MSEAIRQATIGEILALRHAMLRAGFPIESARFDGDDDPRTRHFAAVDHDAVVGCASFMRVDYDGQPAWQLRGMAVARDRQRQGIGARLLAFAEADCSDPPTLWCNARIEAVAFYERHGWRTASDLFDIPTVGPHRRMVKEVAGSGFRVQGSG